MNLLNALGWALLHSLWVQPVLILFFYGLSLLFSKSAKSYRVLSLAMLLLPVSFLLTVLWVYTPDATDSLTDSLERVWQTFSSHSLEQAGAGQTSQQVFLPILVSLWLLGVGVQSIRLVVGTVFLSRLKRSFEEPPAQLRQLFDSLLLRLALKGSATLKMSAVVSSPMIFGVLRPVVLLPVTALTGLSAKQLELILLHELAHIHRFDPWLNGVQSAIECLFFYHPAVWFLARQIRHERECACDDLVIHLSQEPLVYAVALCQLEGLRHQPQLTMAATGGKFMRRIKRLVQVQNYGKQRWLAVGLLTCLFLAACSSQLLGTKDKTASLDSFSSVCLNAQVATGKYIMPAFNSASVRAMSNVLATSRLELLDSCEGAMLRLDYTMTFSARQLNWQASLTATGHQGQQVWSNQLSDVVEADGAYQYTTEHVAETLLRSFLQDKN